MIRPADMRRFIVYAWASPCSMLGLLLTFAAVAAGGSWRWVDGTIEAAIPRWAGRLRWPFDAITFGHVILGVNHRVLEALRAHEQVHVRQYERWGALFLLAYPMSSLWQLLRGRDPYWNNRFEVQARAGAAASAGNPVRART